MADGPTLRTEDRRKRARQNGVVQPLLTGMFSIFSPFYILETSYYCNSFVEMASRTQ
jgi:hypothetical protein